MLLNGPPFVTLTNVRSWNSLITLHEAWNKPEKAKQWPTRLPQSNSQTQQGSVLYQKSTDLDGFTH